MKATHWTLGISKSSAEKVVWADHKNRLGTTLAAIDIDRKQQHLGPTTDRGAQVHQLSFDRFTRHLRKDAYGLVNTRVPAPTFTQPSPIRRCVAVVSYGSQ